MASCVLIIDSVLGGPSQPIADDICQTFVTVTGRVIDGIGGACPAVSVTIRCHNGVFETTGGVSASGHLDGPGTVSGYLANGRWQVVLQTLCCCDRDMVVTASCPALGCSDDASAPLQCVARCCPVVVGKAKTGPCDPNGHANVDFSVATLILDNCAPTDAKLDWGDGSPFGQGHVLPAGQGGFTDSHVYAPGQYIARVITGSPENCPSIGIAVTVDCPPPPDDCCPEIETIAQCGPCNPHGISQVVLTTSVLIGDGCPPATVRIEHGDGSSASHVFAASGQFAWPAHPYPSGQHSVSVAVTSPQDCPGSNFSFNVPCPPPPCCPQISASAKLEPCGPDGLAPVTFIASVQPAADPACPAVSWRYDFGDGVLEPARGPGTFNDVRFYPAGPHSATIKLLSPPGCADLPVGFNVNCPDCCPDVTIVPCIPDCGKDADREVIFRVTVTPKGSPCPEKAIAFQMDFGDGGKGQALSIPAGGGPLSFEETHTYSGQHALQDNDAALNVSEPPECARSYPAPTIPACCTKKRAKKCQALFLVMSWDLTLALLFFLFWILGGITLGCVQCAPFNAPSAVHKYLFYAFAIAGLLLLAIYLIFCVKCSCGWLYRLLWRMLFGAGAFYAIYAGCALSWLSVLIGLVLILISFVFLKMWKSKCCVSECKYLKEIFVWGVAQVYALTALLTTTHIAVGCLFVLFTLPLVGPVTVFGVATIMVIAFSLYFVNKCVR